MEQKFKPGNIVICYEEYMITLDPAYRYFESHHNWCRHPDKDELEFYQANTQDPYCALYLPTVIDKKGPWMFNYIIQQLNPESNSEAIKNLVYHSIIHLIRQWVEYHNIRDPKLEITVDKRPNSCGSWGISIDITYTMSTRLNFLKFNYKTRTLTTRKYQQRLLNSLLTNATNMVVNNIKS